jgi:hypothetical protein
MPPRNRRDYESGQELRAAVRAIMVTHHPLAPPLTAKEVNDQLPEHLRCSDRNVRHVMQEIRCHHGNSSLHSDAA